MGMFDEVKCSAPIGELTNILTQTKDISDDYWDGGTMSFYWIDPSGYMWATDYSGSYDLKLVDGRYTPVKNKNRGRTYKLSITKNIEIYDYKIQSDGYVDGVVCELRLNQGRLVNYKYK